MKKNKAIVSISLSVLFLSPGFLYALKGTAIRRIINYSPFNFMMMDSNGDTFKQGPVILNRYGVLVPTQTDYHKSNDAEIKQDPKNAAKVYLYTDKMRNEVLENVPPNTYYSGDPYMHLVPANYALSDYDWRIWFVSGGRRTSSMVYDKQHLKELYKKYRIGIAQESLNLVKDIAESVASKQPKVSSGIIAAIADSPATKDVRLYIMPDGSIIFTSDDNGDETALETMVLEDLVKTFKGDPKEEYRFLYQHYLDGLVRDAAYLERFKELTGELQN